MATDPVPGGGTKLDAGEGSSLLVRSELMQHYTAATAIGSDPYLVSALDRGGETQLFSLGSDGDAYNIFPLSTEATGWAVRKLEVPVDVQHLVAGRELEGSVVVLACGSDNHIYWKSDEPWSPWTDLGQPFGQMTVKALRTGYDREGQVIFQAIASFDDQGFDDQDIVIRIYPRQGDNPWDYVSQYILGEIYDCAPGSGAFGDGAYVSSSDQLKNNTNVTFYQDHQIPLREVFGAPTGDMIALAGARDAGGTTQLFCLSESQQAFYVDPLAEEGENLVSLSKALDGSQIPFVEIAASRFQMDGGGEDYPLQFFGVSQSGSLYHCRQQYPVPEPNAVPASEAAEDGPGGTPLQWSPLTRLGDGIQATSKALTLCYDTQGTTHCYAVTQDGNLIHFWQDETTDWQAEPVVLTYEGDVFDVPSYSTEVTLLDDGGSPLPGQVLQVGAAQSMTVEVNGIPYRVNAEQSVPCETNAAGRITIVTPTGTLGMASFQIGAATLGDDVLTIAPDRYIQDYLYPDTPADLEATLSGATYTTESGAQEPLIDMATYGSSLPDASAAIWQSMSLGQPESGDPAATALRVSRRGDQRGVQIMPKGSLGNRIDPAKVKPQYWRIEFLDQGVRFHQLRDYAHYRQVVEELEQGIVPTTELFSVHLPKPDWGDLWHGVRAGAAQLENIAVATVTAIETEAGEIVSRVESTIQTLVDGLSSVVSYVVDTIQQVFDVAQGVLEALEADFEKVYRWLGSLFDWQSIVAAHTSIASVMNSVIYTQMPASIDAIKTEVDGFFDNLSTDGVSAGADGDTSLGEGYSQALDKADQAPGPSSNWLQNQLLNAGGGDPTAEPGVSGPGSTDPLTVFEQEVVSEMGDLYDTIVQQLNAAIAQGQSADNLTPNQILGIVTTMIENDALAAGKAVADVAFDLVEFVLTSVGDVANTPWHIPVVSKLYKEQLGSEMSLLDLVALALALPTTVAAKAAGLDLGALQTLATNVDVLVSHLTPAQLMGQEEIDEETQARLVQAGLELDATTSQVISQLLGLIYSFAQIVLSPFSWMYALDKIKNKWVKAIPVFLSLVVLVFSFPFCNGLPTTSYDWITTACWAVSFLLWFSCGALPAVLEFLPAKPVDPERQPLLKKNVPATTTVTDWVTGIVSLVGGVLLLGGYFIQEVVEAADGDYLPNATVPEKAADLTLKALQNFLGTLPGAAQCLKWHVFDEYGGKAILGGVSILGYAGAGTCSLIRDGVNVAIGQEQHII